MVIPEKFTGGVRRVPPPLRRGAPAFVAEARVRHALAFAAWVASRSAISLRTLSHCWYCVRAV